MSDKTKVLVVTHNGVVDVVLSEPEAEVFQLDWDRIDSQDHTYIRRVLVEAGRWPEAWRDKVIFSEVVAIATEQDIPIPEWVVEERNKRLLKTLSDLQS